MFKEDRKQLKFEWSHLGDIKAGRPNLGPTTSVAIYRLMQFTLRDAAIMHTNVETANRIMYDAGLTSGKAIYENLIVPVKDINELASKLQKILKELNIGILRFEKIDSENMNFILTVSLQRFCLNIKRDDF